MVSAPMEVEPKAEEGLKMEGDTIFVIY